MELPEPVLIWPAPAMNLDQFDPGEQAVSVTACQNYAKLFAKDYAAECVRLALDAERDRWIAWCSRNGQPTL